MPVKRSSRGKRSSRPPSRRRYGNAGPYWDRLLYQLRDDVRDLSVRLRTLASHGLDEDVDRTNIDQAITRLRDMEAATRAAVDTLTRARPRHGYHD
jgi:hypothetical protein